MRPSRRSSIRIALIAAAGAFALYAFLAVFTSALRKGTVDVVIQRGTSFSHALALFREAGAFRTEFPFRVLGRVYGVDRALKPGLYRIPANATPLEVFRMLRNGEIQTVTFTVPEGYTLIEIADVVEKAGIGRSADFLALAKDPQFLKEIKIEAPSLEGFLFPDTYTVPTVSTPREVILTMVDRFRQIIDKELRPQIEASKLSLLEVVTLASIVEKEAKQDFERPIIASVYLNRLARNMRLEADPTILYGIRPLGEPIRFSEIRNQTPYNTYVIRGLPPGPIANPGLASLRAVLSPETSNYLYFVAREDGTHQFSRTLEEHNRAVRSMRRNHR